MKKNKAIKYRIYPNKKQQSLILKTFSCSRFVYNYMLEESIRVHDNGESYAKERVEIKISYNITKF